MSGNELSRNIYISRDLGGSPPDPLDLLDPSFGVYSGVFKSGEISRNINISRDLFSGHGNFRT